MIVGPSPYLRNGEAFDLRHVPSLAMAEFRQLVIDATCQGSRLAAFFGVAGPPAGPVKLYAVLAHDRNGRLSLLATKTGDTYPALTPDCPQAHWFEREIAEQWGVRPEGHPWLKPIRFHHSRRPGHDAWGRVADAEILPGVTDYFTVQGEEIHEVAVGPVHAGVIEPGHFRFQCHGEEVLHLEIELGYQHRGIERALLGGPTPRTLPLIETLAGDTTIGHSMAYAMTIESLTDCALPGRAEALRGLALELERMANHTGDLGALAGDVGYLPTASYCGRLRGDLLNMTALLCGNRFGRSLICSGGVRFDADESRLTELATRLEKTMTDLTQAVELLWESPSVMARFEDTGALSRQAALDLGLVGPPARACGVERDVRGDFPTGIYNFHAIPPSTWESGDVFARAFVRWLELQRSAAFVREMLKSLPGGPCRAALNPLAARSLPAGCGVVSLVEGWRGEICHIALTDAAGRLAAYKIVDPSFHNWFGLALALRGQQVSDFPLCNKSFNLSYCGHDL